MNEVKKITNLVIDKQPNLDINELINCLNNCQERINKAIEYLDKVETLAMPDGKIIFSINTIRNILQKRKK